MKKQIIGLECSVSNSNFSIGKWLAGLEIEKYRLFIQTLMLNDLSKDNIFGKEISLAELENINKLYGIMEITLSIFPENELPCNISDYVQFLSSPSICCLIYYDAGCLEVYVKTKDWIEIIEQNLQKCELDYIAFKTFENDGRISF